MTIKKTESLFHFLAKPKTMVWFALIMTILFSIVSLIPLSIFNANEQPPDLVTFVPGPDAIFGEEVQKVKTGLYVDDFPGFDMVTNAFTLEGIAWFQFDPSNISPAAISKFSFEGGNFLEKNEIDSALIGNELRVQYKIKVEFSSALEHDRFPFADHRIFLVLTNNFFSSKDQVFESLKSGFTTNAEAIPDSWTLVSQNSFAGFAPINEDEHTLHERHSAPLVVYSFDFKKPGFRQAMTLIIPLFLIYLLGVFALVIRSEKDSATALELAIGSISGLVAYRYVVEQVSPKVGYLLVSDYLHLMFFVAGFIIFLHCAYAHGVTTRMSDEQIGEQLRNDNGITALARQEVRVFYGIQIAVLITTVLIVIHA